MMSLLAMAMIVPTPSSGKYNWRNHIAEKSPLVQPIRHLVVLTEARRQVDGDAQNRTDAGDREWEPHARVAAFSVPLKSGDFDLQEYHRSNGVLATILGDWTNHIDLLALNGAGVSKPKSLAPVSASRECLRAGFDRAGN
ncbi:hypothetical protein ABKA04_000972 [Annulohypoxylon sp. FPYF3050]